MGRRETLATVFTMLLWFGGCPKRQVSSGIIYVPAAAPKPSEAPPSSATQQVMVIEEPAPPPEPEESPPPQTPEPAAPHPRRRPARPTAPPEPSEANTPETPDTPPTEIPALVPRESSMGETELRQQVQKVQQDVRQRLARLDGARLSANERKTLDDAHTFFEQSNRAMESGDLQRALNLARKASLLIAALE